MEEIFLQPGFRFHPTDVELIMYYLVRKVNKKRFPVYEIAEVKLYDCEPWELKEKSSLRSRDLEWFFFCSRERKYARGQRTQRATKDGYWKTTGEDKYIRCNSKIVGLRRTLVFYKGKAPRGERMDWVMHEYRIEDGTLIKEGFSKDSYVLCKIFKKSGRGPKNGEQHGAPYDEDEWEDNCSERNDTSITAPLAGPSSAALWPEDSEVLTVTRAAESVDGHPLVLDQSTLGTLPMNGTVESNSVIDQLPPGPKESEILAGNGREEPVDGRNFFVDELPPQSGGPVVNKRHDPSRGYDNVEFFDVEQLLSEIDEKGGSCNEENLDAPTDRENGNKDVMLADHDLFRDLGEIVSYEELSIGKEHSPYNLPFLYNPSDFCSTFRDGSFLEQDDLEPMQDDDLFGNGTNDDLHFHSSTMSIPASQETQDPRQYWATAPIHNAEETVTEYIPPFSARGERHDELLSLDCMLPASATAAGCSYLSMEDHTENVLLVGSVFHIQAQLILFLNESSHLPCMHFHQEKPGAECSLHFYFTGRQKLQIHSIVSVGYNIGILSRMVICHNYLQLRHNLLFNNQQLFVTNIR